MFLSEFCEHDTPTCASCNSSSQKIGQSVYAPLPCDAWHHYYHYQASAQYLWLAETLRALKATQEMQVAYKKAVFQDHYNAEALSGRDNPVRDPLAPLYDKHPLFDMEFCGLIGLTPGDATQQHDTGARHLMAGETDAAAACFTAAIAADAQHSNSRFGRGKCRFLQKRYDEALADFREAVRLSHQHHDLYHRLASMDHVARGKRLLEMNEPDLAVSSFTKALDLYPMNKEALKSRAQAYRAKGSERLAEEDENKLNRRDGT